MAYLFYLSKCLLPVTPDKLTTEINGKNKVVTLINEGEVNILKKPGLTEMEFTCMLPNVKYPFGIYKSGFRKASYFLDYFENLKTSRKPFQFIVTRKFPNGKAIYDTNMKVSLEEYTVEESADEGFDCKVTIKLKQWKDYGTKTVKVSLTNKKVSAKSSRSSESASSTSTSRTYTVVKGDCLYSIARKFYGDGTKYTVIYNANKSVIGGDPSQIYAGQVLTIPTS